ncbi:hypothetical protein DFJ74DRAFT_647560 [Hyaloraphidium curvatum]|nr:hypothetical protein DFJ74DRAFT_647560 [Hyaloraphidium curvatum]
MPQRTSCAALLALLCAAAAGDAGAASPSWPAAVEIVKTSGPTPAPGSRWRQCAELRVTNPAGMVAGVWRGSLKLDGAALSSSSGAAFSAEGASILVEGTRSLAPGETADGVRFCVDYRNAWSALPDISVSPAGADEHGVFADQEGGTSRYYVEVEPHGDAGSKRHVLLRRQVGGFYPDYSSGNCRCLPAGVAPPPPSPPSPPPPPPLPSPDVRTSTAAPSTTTAARTTTTPVPTTTTAAAPASDPIRQALIGRECPSFVAVPTGSSPSRVIPFLSGTGCDTPIANLAFANGTAMSPGNNWQACNSNGMFQIWNNNTNQFASSPITSLYTVPAGQPSQYSSQAPEMNFYATRQGVDVLQRRNCNTEAQGSTHAPTWFQASLRGRLLRLYVTCNNQQFNGWVYFGVGRPPMRGRTGLTFAPQWSNPAFAGAGSSTQVSSFSCSGGVISSVSDS